MGYLHIDNLYKNDTILLFKECYALEKVHGTSAHISYKDDNISFFAGGAKHEEFIQLFDAEKLLDLFRSIFPPSDYVTIFGEAYGGRVQKMQKTYGNKLSFIVFEVRVNKVWYDVPRAHKVADTFGLEFVPYNKIPTTIEAINAERDSESIVAIRRGCGAGQMREGVVLRPLTECILSTGDRIIAKHKRPEFSETRRYREVGEKLTVEYDPVAIADEWVTYQRLLHVSDKNRLDISIENISKLIPLMQEDILREAKGEIVDTVDVKKYLGRATALLIKKVVNSELEANVQGDRLCDTNESHLSSS